MKLEPIKIEQLERRDAREIKKILSKNENEDATMESKEVAVNEQSKYEETKEEKILKESKITTTELEPLEGDESEAGSNINFMVELEDGSRGILKLYDPENVNITYPDPEKMERINYIISNVMGFNLVPPTIVKEISTKGLTHPKLDKEKRTFKQMFGKIATGSLQQWIEDAQRLEDIGEESVPKNKLLSLYVFDYIMANWDRHPSNILIADEQIYAIDNEASLFELDREAYYSLINNLQKVADEIIPENLYNIFSDFKTNETKREIIYKELFETTNEEHTMAAFSRIDQIGNLILNNKTLTEEQINQLKIR